MPIAFSKLLEFMTKPRIKSGIEQPSVLLESVQYGSNLYLGSLVM
jgi:UDP-3-O-[3-hydroxymyristoyl] glucosamine N-acyltransferase